MTNVNLAKQLPAPPAGHSWRIEYSTGDELTSVVTVHLVHYTSLKPITVFLKEVRIGGSNEPTGIVSLVAQAAREIEKAHKRHEVLQTLPGLYDGIEALDFEPEEQKEAA